MATITLLNLYRSIARATGYAQGAPSSGGTSKVNLVDVSDDSPFQLDDSDQKYSDAFVMIEADSSTPTKVNVSEVRRARDLGSAGYTASTGTIVLDRGFTSNIITNHTYGIYFSNPPTRVGTDKGLDEYINEYLRNMFYWHPTLLTLAPDGDMEASGTTNFTQVGTCTLAKSTTTGITFGLQSLSCTNGAANSGAKLNTALNVVENEAYDITVDVDCSGYTGKLIAYDVTNSADIDSVTTVERGQRCLWLHVTIPTNCKQMNVHMTTTDAAGVAYWDNLSVRRTNALEIAMPSWFVDQDWIEELFYVGGGSQEGDNDSWNTDRRQWLRVQWWRILRDHNASTQYKLRFSDISRQGYHLFAKCIRPFAEFTHSEAGLATTTSCAEDWIRAWVLSGIYLDKGNEQQAQQWLAKAREKDKRYQPFVQRRVQLAEAF